MSVAPDSGLAPNVFRPAASVGDGFVERTVTTKDGVRLAVSDYSAERADAPTVVLLHGLLLSQESWASQVCQLRRRYGRRIRIITYDHRGHGRSSAAPMPTYEIARLAADLAERKTVWSANLAKKDALIAKVEALQESTDWDATAAEIRKLQAEWKTIGPVKKSRSEALWQRFRGACDHFFARYAQRHDIARGERVAAREAIVAELEALAAPVASHESQDASPESQDASPESQVPSPESPVPSPEPPADLVAKVRALRGRWNTELAARGVDRERAAALDERFAAAFARVVAQWPAAFSGTDLDPSANRKRMEALVNRMEELAKSLGGPAVAGAGDAAVSPTTRLAAMLKEALAANTIGGKVDDDSRFRAANEEVRQAQASWSRIGPVPDDIKRALADRFQRALRRISDAGAAHARGIAGIGSGRPGARPIGS